MKELSAELADGGRARIRGALSTLAGKFQFAAAIAFASLSTRLPTACLSREAGLFATSSVT